MTKKTLSFKTVFIAFCIIFFSQATIVCDMVVLYVLKKRNYYKNKKYLMVDDVEGGGYEVGHWSKVKW